MKPPLRRFALFGVLVLCSSCANASAGTGAPRMERDLLTREQIREHGYTNLYQAIEAVRPRWLQTRGTDSFNNPTRVQVYLDDIRLGGIEHLRSIATSEITYVRYYDGISASARWGLDHGQGVIFVSRRPL
ncbi:MAG TPA: hypothetical protein VHG28_08430 [Longimicrobiaceae bacterium]|nr:hypothetical protein [Longimicrobiaceae bacterium]